jgi:nucleoside-diphosphate-sugar epimerase
MEIDMKSIAKTVLVFGATGQQGGSVATALRSHGWQVKALVRDPDLVGVASRLRESTLTARQHRQRISSSFTKFKREDLDES